ncbi:MAG: prolipoprotein diacylglyceryl transferase [Aureliella sp.]
MRSTLFFVPHEIAGFPLFGVGLLLALIVVGYVTWLFYCLARGRKNDAFEPLPMIGIGGAIVCFVLPAVESTWPDGTPIGLPIRGYGIMVLLGLISGIAICIHRGRQLGIDPDTIMGLGFWMMVTGVVGARLFYVIQKWDDFQTIGEIFQFTEGGLVIYGGVLGGLLACTVYCFRKKLNLAATADLVAPGFLIGLSFGRLGCLLHGCCFGGVCPESLPSIRFPHGSIPYQSQLNSGALVGITTKDGKHPGVIDQVEKGSVAERAGVAVGQQLKGIAQRAVEKRVGDNPATPNEVFAEIQLDNGPIALLPSSLPHTSLPTHPSQIYSAINAALLCALIWWLQPFPRHDGVVFAASISLYAASRFVLEWVRSDESGQLGTSLTISQLISLGAMTLAIAAILWLRSQTPGRSWNWGQA